MDADIIRMAREAGFSAKQTDVYFDRQLVRFAALVRANERERIGDQCAEQIRTAIEDEQDRCCRIIFGMAGSDNVAQRTVDAIRSNP